MISESTRFLAQPREMRLTLIMVGQELADVRGAHEQKTAARAAVEIRRRELRAAYFFFAGAVVRAFLRFK